MPGGPRAGQGARGGLRLRRGITAGRPSTCGMPPSPFPSGPRRARRIRSRRGRRLGADRFGGERAEAERLVGAYRASVNDKDPLAPVIVAGRLAQPVIVASGAEAGDFFATCGRVKRGR